MTYFINEKENCIVNAKNGDIIRPSCMVDLVAYYKYVLHSKGEIEASKLLKRVIQGERVISDMVDFNKHKYTEIR